MDRDREREALELVREQGYDVMPFGFTEWRAAVPRLAELAKGLATPLRVAPDALVDTPNGPAWLETVNCAGHKDRGLSLSKLAGLWPWHLIAPVWVLDMADGHAWRYDPAAWPYAAVDDARGPSYGPRGEQKPYAWLSRTDDRPFTDVWPLK